MALATARRRCRRRARPYTFLMALGEDYCLWDHLTEEEAAPLRRLIAEFGEAVKTSARLVEAEDREEIERLEAIARLPAIPEPR